MGGPTNDGTPELREAIEDSALGSTLPSAIGEQVMKEGSEWKLLLGQRCKGRDGTLIQWPTGRTEMCPTGTQPVHGNDYQSWQCDGSYKKEERLHCCSVKGKMKCVPNLVDKAASQKCNCQGVGGGGWSEEEEDNKPQGRHGSEDEEEGPSQHIGLPPLPVLLLTSFGPPHQSQRTRRRGCTRQVGKDFL